MQRIWTIPALAALLAVTSQAQIFGRDDDRYQRDRRNDGYYGNDPYSGRNGSYGNDPYYGRNSRGNYGYGSSGVVDRTLSDLRDAQRRSSWFNRGDRKHLDKAIDNLSRFQSDYYNKRKFNNGKLDKALSEMSHLRGRNRRLEDDVYALRDLRASGGRYDQHGYGRYGAYRP
jgi:hypothetical protein